jgi:hypothetical protein
MFEREYRPPVCKIGRYSPQQRGPRTEQIKPALANRRCSGPAFGAWIG